MHISESLQHARTQVLQMASSILIDDTLNQVEEMIRTLPQGAAPGLADRLESFDFRLAVTAAKRRLEGNPEEVSCFKLP